MAIFARSAERRLPAAQQPIRTLSRLQKATALALTAIDLGIGAIVAEELYAPGRVGASATLAATRAVGAAPPNDNFALPPLSAYNAVTERPLFARNRRPLSPQAAAVAVGDAKSFVLAGITISGEERTALVRHGTPPTLARLTEGQEIDGWTVRDIADDRVVLRNEATEYTMLLYKEAAAPAKP